MDLSDVAKRASDLAKAIQEIEATALSPDRLVSVTVVPGNAVTALGIAPAAMRARRAGALAAVILETIRDALRQLEMQVAARLADLVPVSIGRTQLQDSLAGRLPAPGSADPDPPEVDEVPEPELPAEWAERGAVSELAAAAQAWDAFEATTDRLSAPYRAVAERFAATESTGHSPGGEVEVTVRAGEVVGLTISDAALHRHDAASLAAQILATLQQARAELAVRLAAQAQALTGPAIEVRDLVERHQSTDTEERR